MSRIIAVVAAIACAGIVHAQAAEELIQGLKSPDSRIRRSNAEKIGRKRIESAIPQLQELLKDDLKAVREAAADSLTRFGAKAAKPLGEALAFPKDESKMAALNALRELGPEAKDALATLTPLLKAKKTGHRIVAAQVLGQIGPDAKSALPALFEAAKDMGNEGTVLISNQPSSVCHAAVIAAIQIDPSCKEKLAKAILPDLIQSLKSKDKALLQAALFTVAELGVHAKPALESIRDAERNAGRFGQEAAQRAISAITGKEFEELFAIFENKRLPAGQRLRAFSDLNRQITDRAKQKSLFKAGLKDTQPAIRAEALFWMFRLDEETKTLLPLLIGLLDDDQIDQSSSRGDGPLVVDAIASIGKPAVPALIEVLKDKTNGDFARYQALQTISRLGPSAREARPLLESAANDKIATIAIEASCAYVLTGGDVDKVLPRLRKNLKHSSSSIVYLAAYAIERMAHRAKEAAPDLTTLLDHEDSEVRIVAARSLCRMGEIAKPAVKRMAALLKEDDGRQQFQISQALSDLGPMAADAIPALIEMYKKQHSKEFGGIHPDPCLKALVKMGPAGKPATPFLRELIKERNAKSDEYDSGVNEALDALGAIGAKEAVPEMVSLLDAKSEWRRAHAVRAIGMIGWDAKGVEKKLRDLTNDDSQLVRVWACFALARIADDAPKHLKQLIEEWTDQPPKKGSATKFVATGANMEIAEALGLLGKLGRPGQDTLISGLKTQRSMAGIHGQVVDALIAITDDPDKITMILIDELNTGKVSIDWYWREGVIVGLGHLGPKAKAAVPHLKRWLEEANAKQGLMIETAISKIEAKK